MRILQCDRCTLTIKEGVEPNVITSHRVASDGIRDVSKQREFCLSCFMTIEGFMTTPPAQSAS